MITPEEFYPTPPSIIERMLKGFDRSDIREWQILEPSAGTGSILDYLTTQLRVSKAQLYAIEADAELSYNLQGKEYRVIGHDFLEYDSDYAFDLVVMNPPFSNGDQHLLKAWEVMQSGHIVCLLNEETIKNPYTERRKLLKHIIEQHGSVEYLGPVFRSAARKTDVGIAMVKLHKNEPDRRFIFDFGQYETEERPDFTEDIAGNTVALNDVIGNTLRQYDQTKKAYIDYIKAKKALEFYSQGLVHESGKVMDMADKAFQKDDLPGSYNRFTNELKMSSWVRILSKLNIEKYLTAGVRANFTKFRANQGGMDLTRENIRNLVGMIVANRSNIMTQAVVDVFDIFTKFHEQNRAHIEGWKTNSAWKVNRKVILPWYLSWGYSNHFTINHRRYDEFHDIDKVMCWLTGKQLESIDRLSDAIKRVRIGDSGLHTSEFFEFRCFKKNTLHLTFRDTNLWDRFNQEACKGKNWLPG
jgi:predicted RNA methylase